MRATLLFVALAACGGGGAATTDAASDIDGAIDGPSGEVAVHVVRRDTGAPDEGVPVLSHDGDGALIARGETDANGDATLPIDAGGSVTVFDARYLSGRFATVLAAEPGDSLQFATGQLGSSDEPVTVTVPTSAGADSYLVSGGTCLDGSWSAQGGGTATAYARGGCTAWPVVARTVDAQSAVTGYLFDANADWAGGSLTMSGTWQAPSTFSLELSGFAADEVLLGANTMIYSGGKDITSDGVVDIATDASGHAIATWPAAPEGIGDAIGVVVARIENGQVRAILDSDGGWRASASIDVSDLGASVPHPEVTSTGASWSAITGEADGLFLRLGADAGEWDLVVPPDATSLTLPAMPADLAGEVGTVSGLTDVRLLDSTLTTGYAAFRADADALSHRDFVPISATGAFRVRIALAFP